VNIRTPENSRRLAQMVQGLEPEERWALLDRAEEVESFEELGHGSPSLPKGDGIGDRIDTLAKRLER
jgi:hypothetical protein